MGSFLTLPTSKFGALPYALNSLDSQLKTINNDADKAGKFQVALSKVTAFAVVFFAAIVDVAQHAAFAVVYAVPTFLNVTVGRLSGLDKHLPDAITGSDYANRFAHIHAAFSMIVPSLTIGLRNPAIVLGMGRDLQLMTVKVGKGDAGVTAAPSAT